MNPKIIELTKANFNQEVLQSELPVLVDFWAPWCNPCLTMGQILDELVDEVADKIKIAKLNVAASENQELAIKYGIQGIPALKIFNGGKIVKEMTGVQARGALMEIFKEFI